MFITTAGGQRPIWLYLMLQEKGEALKVKAAYQLERSLQLDFVGHLRWTVGSSKYSGDIQKHDGFRGPFQQKNRMRKLIIIFLLLMSHVSGQQVVAYKQI